MEKKVYIGNDTAGYYLKSKCIEYLEGKGIPYVDCGSEDDPDIEEVLMTEKEVYRVLG